MCSKMRYNIFKVTYCLRIQLRIRMDKTFNQLDNLGYKKRVHLIGLNQFLSKERIFITHSSKPNDPFEEHEEEGEVKPLSNGILLNTKLPSSWYNDFSSDIVLEEGEKVRKWRTDFFSNTFHEWVFSKDETKAEYSSYSMYYNNMNDDSFAELINMLFKKVNSLTNMESRLPQVMSLLIHTDFRDAELMGEIVSTHGVSQVDKFILAVKQCKQLDLPIADYREVFNYSQTVN